MGQTWLWGSDAVTPGVNPDAAFGIPPDTFWMSGHDGQSVCIIKSRQLVIVRLGLTPYAAGYTSQRLVQAVLEATQPQRAPAHGALRTAQPARALESRPSWMSSLFRLSCWLSPRSFPSSIRYPAHSSFSARRANSITKCGPRPRVGLRSTAFIIVAASLYIGAYVLGFFGVSLPVLRVAGGIIVAAAGWRMLNAPDVTEQRRTETPEPKSIDVAPSRLAFYPLTMPLTTGPGTISVAVSLGAGRPSGFHASSLLFFVETLAATALLSVLIYGFYRNSAYLAKWIGVTGTTIVVRLSAFLLFCIGIQVGWNGLSELLGSLPYTTVS